VVIRMENEENKVKKKPTLKSKLFKIVKEYSEYSTIAGLVYLFMEKQTRYRFRQHYMPAFFV